MTDKFSWDAPFRAEQFEKYDEYTQFEDGKVICSQIQEHGVKVYGELVEPIAVFGTLRRQECTHEAILIDVKELGGDEE